MTEGVFNCLIDEKRTNSFSGAIANTVRAGDIVVDMGTGSGVLAMMAVRAGARKVYAVEYDANNIATLNKTFEKNGLSDAIEIIEGDVTKVSMPEKVDVIIGEMIATGLIEELQAHAMNNMLKYASENIRVVLEKYDVYVDLVENNEQFYGYDFKIVRYEYPDEKLLESRAVTNRYCVASFDFSKPIVDLNVSAEFSLTTKQDGTYNALRIDSETTFFDKSKLGATSAYSYPIILPLETRRVVKGQNVQIKLSYVVNGGMGSLNYTVE